MESNLCLKKKVMNFLDLNDVIIEINIDNNNNEFIRCGADLIYKMDINLMWF